ncbi:MAG: metallophosphoesterase family protein [Alphaproteobacteria bacterium]|nr:metallophosphoesterase family protein [Alphaproteobacteria bacterium]
MFSKTISALKGGRAGAPRVPAPRVPEGTRVYAIGDIHGRLDLLAQLRERIVMDSGDFTGERKVVVYLGDYVDRGPQSREVIDLLVDAPLGGFESVHLKGNHDKFLLDFLDDASVWPLWLYNGAGATVMSYGVTPTAGAEGLQAEFRARIPARHLEFLRSLALSHAEGDYYFVHAGVRPGVALEDQDEADMIWIRDPFLSSCADHGKIVVHGHSIAREPEIEANRIGIDTGAYATGKLTCLVLEGEGRAFLHT